MQLSTAAFFSRESGRFAIIFAITPVFAILSSGILTLLFTYLSLWLLPAALIAAAVYWLDRLPYQHHWNPSVRDLYPYRRHWSERKVMVLLHRANVFHSRRWRKRVQLPPELWVQIIIWAIDSPYHFATLCEPKNFHRFVRGHSCKYFHPSEYQALSKWTKEVRLVSHLWAETLNFRSQWVHARGMPEQDRPYLHHKVRRVDFDLRLRFDPSKPTTVQDEEHLSMPPSELSIVSVCISSGSDAVLYTRLSTEVHTHAARFKSARGFILETPFGHVASEPLAGIERSFSHITSLTLIAHQISGALSLEHLEILILSAEQVETQGWNVPRLAHLALGIERDYSRLYTTKHNLLYTTALFPGASLRLRSLHLNPVQVLDTTGEFWVDHPLLEYLGISSSGFQPTHPPPPDHPLAHIYFWESTSSITNMNIQHVTTILASIPQLRTIVVPNNPSDTTDSWPGPWVKLARAEKRRGVRWIGPFGDEIDHLDFLSTLSDRKGRKWETWWTRAFTLHHIYDIIRVTMRWDHYGGYAFVVKMVLTWSYAIFILWDNAHAP